MKKFINNFRIAYCNKSKLYYDEKFGYMAMLHNHSLYGYEEIIDFNTYFTK